MAKASEAKIRFTAETGEFNDKIKRSNDEMAKLRAEMKLNAQEMKNTGTSVEGLEKKQKLLTSQLEASRDKTEALAQKVEKAKEIYGENSAEVKKFEIQLLNAQTAEKKLEAQVSSCNDELDEHRKAAKDADSSFKKLNDTIGDQKEDLEKLKDEYVEAVLQFGEGSDEANELAKQIDDLSSELAKNSRKLDDAKKSADKFDNTLENVDDAAEEAGDGFTVFKGVLADLVSNGIQTAISTVNDFVSSLFGLPEATREIRQDFATLETAFDNVGFSTETATNTWKELYRVFGEDDRAIETANNIARIAGNQEDLNKWVTITQGVWGTYQDSLPVEGLAEAAAETAKTGTVTGGLADALNWSSEAAVMFADYMSEDVVTAEDAFNEALKNCTTEQERQELITSTLTKLYGDAAKTYEESSGAMLDNKEATAENILAENELAEALEPVNTEFTKMKTTLLTELTPAIVDISSGMMDTLKWMKENKVAVIAITSVIGVLATAIGVLSAAKAVKVAMDAAEVTTIWALVAAHWAQAAAGMAALAPYLLIVAAIAAVIAIIILCIKYWDNIVDAVKKAWKAIQKTLAKWGDWINKNVIQPVVKFFKNLWADIVGIFTSVIDWVKANWQSIVLFLINPFAGIFKYLYDNFEGFRNFVDNIISSIGQFFVNLWNGIVSGLQTAWNWVTNLLSTVGSWIYDNVIAPVVQFFTDMWNEFVRIFDMVIGPWIEIAKRALLLLYNEVIVPIGEFFVNLWNGIVSGLQTAWAWIVELAVTVATWINENVIQPIVQFFVDLWNGIVGGLQAAWAWIVEIALTVAGWVNENVIQPVVQFFVDLWEGLKKGASDAWNGIVAVWTAVSSWFNTKIVQPVGKFFSDMWSGAKDGASKAWEGIKSVFSKVTDWFKDTFTKAWTAVKNVFSAGGKIFDGIKEGIANTFKTVVNGIIGGINKIMNSAFSGLNGALKKMKKVEILGVKPFDWIQTFTVPQIPLMAEGGILTKPTLNIAGEAGPEAIIPIDKLQNYISGAIEKTMQVVNLQALVYAIEDLANRTIELNINGQKFATATAGDADAVNGNRVALSKRGLAL